MKAIVLKKSLLLFVLSFTGLQAICQPGNPIFGLNSEVSFDLDMRAIALMDIETSSISANFSFTLPTPTEAGAALGSNPILTNSDNWINYSCANRDVSSRHIEVNVSSGSVPAGLELKLDIGSSSGLGGGTVGTPAGGTITLSSSSQSIITGIGGAYTGDGANNGHQLTYSLHYIAADFDQLTIQTQELTIAFTIVDD